MRQDLKDKWVAGVRSGKFRQGKNFYKYVDKDGNLCHCILGVLAQVLVDSGEMQEFAKEWIYKEDEAPPEIIRTFSFGDDLGTTGLFHLLASEYRGLAVLNDEEGFTFSELADWIEKNVEVTP